MLTGPEMITVLVLLVSSILGAPRQVPTIHSSAAAQTTLFVDYQEGEKPKHILSPVSFSEDQKWQAYVEVDVRNDLGCLYTTRLWVVKANERKLIYLMPPKREAVGNGMEILGWARESRMVLAKTEEWQVGSDAPDTQQVIAIDVATGMVYAPNLELMLDQSKQKQCMFRVTGAGFTASRNVDILVRAQFSTFFNVDETEADVPLTKRCDKKEETWSFNYASGEIKQVTNSEPLLLYKKFVSNGDSH